MVGSEYPDQDWLIPLPLGFSTEDHRRCDLAAWNQDFCPLLCRPNSVLKTQNLKGPWPWLLVGGSKQERPTKASLFYSFRTRSFLDLDLIFQSTHHSSCMVSSRQRRMQSPPSYYKFCSVLEGTCGWFITAASTQFHRTSVYTGRPRFVALHFLVLHRHSGFLFCFVLFYTNWRFVETQLRASL